MHKELIVDAYIKARKELQSSGVKDPSNHQVSIVLSDYLANEIDFSISKKSIASYYKSATENTDSEDINISQIKVVQGLCKYLEYSNYKEFINSTNEIEKEEIKTFSKDNSELPIKKSSAKSKSIIAVIITLSVLLIVGVFIFKTMNKQRWMLWNNDHYEEVDFNNGELANGTLKIYKEERIENFRRIKNPDCDFTFFNKDGSVKVWYGKNKNGELEIFTDIGLHPETGKSLKPISIHMIRKYLCDSY